MLHGLKPRGWVRVGRKQTYKLSGEVVIVPIPALPGALHQSQNLSPLNIRVSSWWGRGLTSLDEELHPLLAHETHL